MAAKESCVGRAFIWDFRRYHTFDFGRYHKWTSTISVNDNTKIFLLFIHLSRNCITINCNPDLLLPIYRLTSKFFRRENPLDHYLSAESSAAPAPIIDTSCHEYLLVWFFEQNIVYKNTFCFLYVITLILSKVIVINFVYFNQNILDMIKINKKP